MASPGMMQVCDWHKDSRQLNVFKGKNKQTFYICICFFVADFSVFKLHKLLKSYQGVAAAHKMGVVSMRENLGPIIHFLCMNTNRFSLHTEWLVTWTLWAMVYRSSKWCDHSWLLCRGDTSQGIVMKWTTQYGALLTSFTVLHYCFTNVTKQTVYRKHEAILSSTKACWTDKRKREMGGKGTIVNK